MKLKTSDNSTFTATLQQFVALQTSYHHRVKRKVELATEMQMLLVGPRKDAVTSVVPNSTTAKHAARSTRFNRESRNGAGGETFPGFALLLSGEIDHVRSLSRFGIGITMEN